MEQEDFKPGDLVRIKKGANITMYAKDGCSKKILTHTVDAKVIQFSKDDDIVSVRVNGILYEAKSGDCSRV